MCAYLRSFGLCLALDWPYRVLVHVCASCVVVCRVVLCCFVLCCVVLRACFFLYVDRAVFDVSNDCSRCVDLVCQRMGRECKFGVGQGGWDVGRGDRSMKCFVALDGGEGIAWRADLQSPLGLVAQFQSPPGLVAPPESTWVGGPPWLVEVC